MLIALLAKSKKHGGRCVAGVEVTQKGGGYKIVRDNGEPRWVRPVTRGGHGEVPSELVSKINLLDIVEFPDLRAEPDGFQSENFTSGDLRPRLVAKLSKTASVLDDFVTTRTGPLFGNRGKAIVADRIDDLDHSLLLVVANDARFEATKNVKGKPQLRVHFTHEDTEYDLPVTDPEFEAEFSPTSSFELCYLTLSVGVENDGWHSKLVASVFLI